MQPWIIPVTKLIHTPKAKTWCTIKYHQHAKGCPKNVDECSQGGYYITDVLDVEKPMWLVHSEFDLEAWGQKMADRHPEWTRRQCRNVLYWQPKSRKQLKERMLFACRCVDFRWATTCPEAYGVNVYATARISGLILEPIKALKVCRHVALLGDITRPYSPSGDYIRWPGSS